MIEIGDPIEASPEQMFFIIEGMRNPKNSWKRSDSEMCYAKGCGRFCDGCDEQYIVVGGIDNFLMEILAKAGTEHRKYMRMMPVYTRITAPLYWWKEFDTYKIGTVANSCSTMHKIQDKVFTLDDFSTDHMADETKAVLGANLATLNAARQIYLKTNDKDYWWQMIQLLPSSYNQTRNVMMNYEVLTNIYRQRKHHKLDEWREFCTWIETKLDYSNLIIKGVEHDKT